MRNLLKCLKTEFPNGANTINTENVKKFNNKSNNTTT